MIDFNIRVCWDLTNIWGFGWWCKIKYPWSRWLYSERSGVRKPLLKLFGFRFYVERDPRPAASTTKPKPSEFSPGRRVRFLGVRPWFQPHLAALPWEERTGRIIKSKMQDGKLLYAVDLDKFPFDRPYWFDKEELELL